MDQLKFKKLPHQGRAVQAVVDTFKGQPFASGMSYQLDPGKGEQQSNLFDEAFRNPEIIIPKSQLLENIQQVQRSQNLFVSTGLTDFKTIKKNQFVLDPKYTKLAMAISDLHLDVEMETGTGKTYCYIQSIFELNQKYGWSKFIIVVPSIAIREGVYESLKITGDHFQTKYHKKAKFFIYNSNDLSKLESYSSDAGINIMIINVQAFSSAPPPGASEKTILNKKNKIYRELDNFQSRRPIDVIKGNRPILIMDEPQKMEGTKTLAALKEFNPLFVLRYSATHKSQHNKIHRLDALDAYNQKLVKKIAVRGISVRGLTGTNAYLYFESVEISKQTPIARVEMEIRQNNGIKRKLTKLKKGDDLYVLSQELDQYKGFVVSDINANTDVIEFTNGKQLTAGEATGNVDEQVIRRIQIRETINAHLKKEQVLFKQGIKVLSLFFIDEVAKYRDYDEEDEKGEYARIFEEEYCDAIKRPEEDLFFDEEYKKHLHSISAEATHNGYFSIDKKGRMVNALKTSKSEMEESTDQSAYDLILKEKKKLLSFEEPTRFIFSHSALREGWDNPNVFVICTLKHSDKTILRRQEVGRGLRICVNQYGERQDHPATVHQINVLTVVASESYKEFVSGLQQDIAESLSERPHLANKAYFTGKVMNTEQGKVEVTEDMAAGIEFYLIQNGYVDRKMNITDKYLEAVKEESLALLELDLQPYARQVFELIDSVYTGRTVEVDNDRGKKTNPLNNNFKKKEFEELWNRINQKAAYSVHFDSAELIKNSISALEQHLNVTPLQYTVERGIQIDDLTKDQLDAGDAFKINEQQTAYNKHSVHSAIKYDLIGKLSANVQLTRKTVAQILTGIPEAVFEQFKLNPESFIAEASRLIIEQKATTVIERLSYDAISERHDMDIFTKAQLDQNFSNASNPLKRHIYDYVVTDSKTERRFVENLDTSEEVVLYAKLPRGFSIPTPVGDYNPDWAIAFKEGSVKHVYFVAETKGDMSTLQLREIEDIRIKCARKFFDEMNRKLDPKQIKYDVVSSYEKLMDLVH